MLEMIARGGMGVVYRARQESLHRIVAVKMLLAGEFAQPKFIERFRAEAEAVAQLQHPNIVAIHEVGEHDGHQFFSMDYVEGKNLAQISAEFGARSAEFHRCASWLQTIAEAVHYAHQRGIIHRDLKPSNILIDAFDQPWITDFGLAKRLPEKSEIGKQNSEMDLTVSGQVLGSPNYLPPEQAEGKHGQVGPPSDIYSLGAILYHLLTGRPPFQAESLTTLLKQVVETDPIPPRLLDPGIPRDLETICLKCLEKDTQRRYQTARDLAADLGRFLEDRPIQARPVNAAGKIARWCRRQPVRAALSAALILTFLFGLVGILWQLNRARAGELLALRHAYAGDIKEAQRAIEESDLGDARRILHKYRPGKPAFGVRQPTLAVDLRGWEWRYLWGQCRSEEQFTLTEESAG
ncbi:MAG: serine/threonine protein kinase, partial [Proteobacteria bacterium]|nr:serine/threonine protein kinase [Pseudomonadota bacterium]